RDQVERGAPPLADLCWSAGARRMHHAYRAACAFQGVRALCDALDDVAAGRRPRGGDLGWIRGPSHAGRRAADAETPGERAAGERAAGDRAGEVRVPGSCEAGGEDRLVMLETLAALYVSGCAVNWTALEPGDRRFVPLPRYPWQHTRHWVAIRVHRGVRRAL